MTEHLIQHKHHFFEGCDRISHVHQLQVKCSAKQYSKHTSSHSQDRMVFV